MPALRPLRCYMLLALACLALWPAPPVHAQQDNCQPQVEIEGQTIRTQPGHTLMQRVRLTCGTSSITADQALLAAREPATLQGNVRYYTRGQLIDTRQRVQLPYHYTKALHIAAARPPIRGSTVTPGLPSRTTAPYHNRYDSAASAVQTLPPPPVAALAYDPPLPPTMSTPPASPPAQPSAPPPEAVAAYTPPHPAQNAPLASPPETVAASPMPTSPAYTPPPPTRGRPPIYNPAPPTTAMSYYSPAPPPAAPSASDDDPEETERLRTVLRTILGREPTPEEMARMQSADVDQLEYMTGLDKTAKPSTKREWSGNVYVDGTYSKNGRLMDAYASIGGIIRRDIGKFTQVLNVSYTGARGGDRDETQLTANEFRAYHQTNYYLTDEDYLFGNAEYYNNKLGGFARDLSGSLGYGREILSFGNIILAAELGIGYRNAEIIIENEYDDGVDFYTYNTRRAENELIYRPRLIFDWNLTKELRFMSDSYWIAGRFLERLYSENILSYQFTDNFDLRYTMDFRNSRDNKLETSRTAINHNIGIGYYF